ncbi:hypothetical protein AtNW77_Chr1g0027861 [Arabidopsis thaliana]|uniref:F5A9.10 n=2 Tax=Arabidopsis TaxID=3701 RepID=Q9FXK6_ARATH|nr:uncharacterized protein AT1G24996 [Arabidopsis thaliana]AAG03111.1 F5A9.10 [Arabidopsis thaliana]AEE30575.1 hypothetical protein AT1G24996 [Arabidopsis thaliana]KAG7647481.1 hypothetical protein ISN45_At01g025200 [Arabidopsis thaliana x Arabidopsis arenosa]|eukprot:NP_173882.1 hypothetical protein AT1G24996 [Arabidopsis thaliana]
MAAPVVVAPAINLQHMDLPEGNEDVAAVLQTSTQRWLNAAEWSILYNNHNLFPESNSFTIPIEVEGLYRVDNRFNQDSNTWRNTSAPSTCKNAINFYNVRIATGLYRFDDDGDIVMDAEVQGGWVLCRKTVRNRGGGVLTFAHYMWVLV